jgi:hypothetical protein
MNVNIGTKEIEKQLTRIADLMEEWLSRGGSGIRSRYNDQKNKEDYSPLVLYEEDSKDGKQSP